METSEPNLIFYYFLYDRNRNKVEGVLSVNRYLTEDILYERHAIKQVSESEHTTMIAFGIPKYEHDAVAHPFFEDDRGNIYDSRNRILLPPSSS
jgi:hypothetical protein